MTIDVYFPPALVVPALTFVVFVAIKSIIEIIPL